MSYVGTAVISRRNPSTEDGGRPGPRSGRRWGILGLVACGLLLGGLPQASAGRCPNLAILLDQSASMAQDPAGVQQAPGAASAKWGIATAALTKLNNRFDGLLPIGYSNFPSANNACMTQGLRVQPGYDNRVTINNAMIAFPFSGGSTPICDAVKKLAAEMALKDPSRGQYILLVTDGAPADACCGASPVQATVDAIKAAAQQSPPIYTFVVGFGKLAATEQAALNEMALAGGYPESGATGFRFYQADSPASLDAALGRILMQINGGDAGPLITCEDGCYGTPCPSGQYCAKNACQPNPCAGKVCGAEESCQADGTCAAVCAVTCPLGSSCSRGKCVADPCSGKCGAGQYCDKSTSQCVADPKCQGVVCHTSQGCFAGLCQDNPCSRLSCPTGYQCRDWDGSCQKPGEPGAPPPSSGGCAVGPAPHNSSTAAALASGAVLLLGLYLQRRRARRATS